MIALESQEFSLKINNSKTLKMPEKKSTMSQDELVQLTKDKEYVPKIAGLKKGSKGKNVERLQAYLKHFGYTKSTTRDEFGVADEREVVDEPQGGTFDDNTEVALRQFQEFNGLEVTGEIDEPTLELMATPRCGFPDTADFTLEGRKWTKKNLTYGFRELTPDLSPAQIKTAIAQAFKLWSDVTPLTFREVPLSSNPDIVIRFVAGAHGDGSAFDGPGGTLAHAFYPPPNGGALAGDAHFDEAETWSVNLPASGTDLVTVAAHEFGHSLGLAHSAVNAALMAPFYRGPSRKLHSDDVKGIQVLYGTADGWRSLGGRITSNISSGINKDGRLEIFVRGTDRAVWHKWQSNGWSGWHSLGGRITSNIGVGQNKDGRLEVFARGTDNALWHKWQKTGGGWSGWHSLGGRITSDPVVGRNKDGRLEVFARGTDNAVWHRWQSNGWSGWHSLGGRITSNIGVGQNKDGRLEVFARGTDNALWHKWQKTGGGWSGWHSLGGRITSDPVVGSQ
jgi:peptidoglycan hydrolase-like protein with peptidoglycan-binding domain